MSHDLVFKSPNPGAWVVKLFIEYCCNPMFLTFDVVQANPARGDKQPCGNCPKLDHIAAFHRFHQALECYMGRIFCILTPLQQFEQASENWLAVSVVYVSNVACGDFSSECVGHLRSRQYP